VPPEHRDGRGRCLLAALLLAAAPALADTGSDWFDTQSKAVQHLLSAEPAAAGRARFMACGFVAPRLTQPDPSATGGDQAFMLMLDALRGYLQRLGAVP